MAKHHVTEFKPLGCTPGTATLAVGLVPQKDGLFTSLTYTRDVGGPYWASHTFAPGTPCSDTTPWLPNDLAAKFCLKDTPTNSSNPYGCRPGATLSSSDPSYVRFNEVVGDLPDSALTLQLDTPGTRWEACHLGYTKFC
jgi:hypothetical protein